MKGKGCAFGEIDGWISSEAYISRLEGVDASTLFADMENFKNQIRCDYIRNRCDYFPNKESLFSE